MKIDMHFHSIRSDWKNTPEDMIQDAKKKNLDFIALTDHDVVSDNEFVELAKSNWINSTKSVEVSAYNIEDDRSIHLTAYSNMFKDDIEKVLKISRDWHMILIDEQIKQLNKNWFNIDQDEMFEYYKKWWTNIDNLNKFNIAEYLFTSEENLKLIKSITWNDMKLVDFYLQFLKSWWKFNEKYWVKVPNYEVPVSDIWDIVKKVDGILSIAHPNYTFKKWVSEFENALPIYIDKWVNAVEINWFATVEWIDVILKAKNKYDLFITFGSDCHKLWYEDDKHKKLWFINPNFNSDYIKELFDEYSDKIL